MPVEIIDSSLMLVYASLFVHKLVTGGFHEQRVGKIGRALGVPGYSLLWIAIGSTLITGAILGNKDLLRAGFVMGVILYVDEFFHRNDPPSKKRRAWLKNKFAKLAPARN